MEEGCEKSGFDSAHFLKNTTHLPGVYQMMDKDRNVIYVGKAKNLKNRLSSYFSGTVDSPKTRALVKHIVDIQITITPNETEALILEHHLIKSLRPRYNVILRDDKSYPYVYISGDKFPRITSYRGKRNLDGQFFGPYPGAGAVRQSIQTVQKLFLIRQCENSYFRNRSRPCLQYQIKRCTAPCVNNISPTDYAKDVESAVLFYQGKNTELMSTLVARMEQSALEQDYEMAARYRDQINAIQSILSKQNQENIAQSLDVFALCSQGNVSCVHGIFIRNGQVLGSQSYFPKVPAASTEDEIFQSFLAQFYLNGRPAPGEIIANTIIDQELILLLSEHFKKKIVIRSTARGEKSKWLDMATTNADNSLKINLAGKAKIEKQFFALHTLLSLPFLPKRIECFDISHTMGEATTASCVVFDRQGASKQHYRRFNIQGVTAGDDYGAMEQALKRRFTSESLAKDALPDILIVDGGIGQLSRAEEVLSALGIASIYLLGVVKGEGRKAENDRIISTNDQELIDLQKSEYSDARFLLQQIRDEAHRFAISGHRNRRDKARKRSILEDLPGISAKKRQALITHLGGLKAIEHAAIEDLKRVPGIGDKLAQLIYQYFHPQ